ncbi:VCBS repeat-containing protein [Pelagicoccus albus]|uniref:VCBS repeat-containing protein n=1 Tax=Pelagicoccus albus TaxID=415222 RepID=A0A7X1B736_9BACT|nr:VCBS repeat-containing protein [Pelagicoccus albus]MBC2606737.1 VCBS repeat-containing protein [Pelagicoccus albus]
MSNSTPCLTLLLAGFALMSPCSGQPRSNLSSEPLALVGSSEYAGPLFETISSEQSGLTSINEYSHPEAWKRYWHQYYNGSIGTAAIVGDVNGDELPDIYLVSKDSANSLYLNSGDFRFEDVTESAGVAGTKGFGSGASFVDIDNDGDLDLYTCYVGSPNQLFLNDGTGRFDDVSEEWGLAINTGTNSPSFADFDCDGDMDLYLQCNFLESANKPEGMPDLLLENVGGQFVDITESAGIHGRGQGHAAIWWDFNEDGLPDLYVANDFEPADKLYRNNGDKTFSDVIEDVVVSAPYFGMGADLGDINNDGHIDFMVADMASPDHVKHHVSVGTQGSYLLGISKTKVSQYMYNMLSLKIGPSQFAEVAQLAGLQATGWTWAVRLVDMDNDGSLDAYFSTGMIREFHNTDLSNRMGNARSVMQRIRAYENSPPLLEDNLAFRNLGSLEFVPVGEEWGLDLNGISFAASFADFDRDGDLDLLINNLNAPPTLYRNRSVQGNRVVIRLEGSESNRYGYGAKVTARSNGQVQTRELTSTRGYMSQDEAIVHFSFEDAESIETLRIDWPSGACQEIENLPLGTFYRIKEANTEEEAEPEHRTLFSISSIEVPDDTESEEEFYDVFGKQALLPFDETWEGPFISTADLDGDGWMDVVMGGSTGQETRVFRNDNGSSLELVESDVFYDDYDSEDSGLSFFDYDSDGDLDLLVLAGSMELDEGSEFYRDRIYLQGEDLEFEKLEYDSFPAPSIASRGHAFLDVDSDGDLDLVIGGGTNKDAYPSSGDNAVWLRTEEGFELDELSDFSRAFAKSGKVSELLSVDVDADGDLDLVQVNDWGVPILWENRSSTLLRNDGAMPARDMHGLWRSVESGDFDGDGRIDIVLGNIGQNSKYKPNSEEPVALFFQKRDGVGAQLLAETVEGELRAMETRNIAAKSFAAEIAANTSTYEEYARKTIEEIFPNLDTAFEKYWMVENRSLLLLQVEDMKFEIRELPREAQIGIAKDLLVADFNQDGWDDLVIAHEPLPPNSWAGRRLRGHISFLLGGPNAEFTALMPYDSGLELEGYPRSLGCADLNGDGNLELLVGTSEGPLVVFELN